MRSDFKSRYKNAGKKYRLHKIDDSNLLSDPFFPLFYKFFVPPL